MEVCIVYICKVALSCIDHVSVIWTTLSFDTETGMSWRAYKRKKLKLFKFKQNMCNQRQGKINGKGVWGGSRSWCKGGEGKKEGKWDNSKS